MRDGVDQLDCFIRRVASVYLNGFPIAGFGFALDDFNYAYSCWDS